ncbi:hypothetical protein J3Q64DRAFT_1678198 [Phycomyces blakesleeanus]|uniref:C2H2-type domain-containing protein n=1 Tax=Phycomyces blakesleeanus TaxID=4837 RepID=A0ABR3AYU0_PHYBL
MDSLSTYETATAPTTPEKLPSITMLPQLELKTPPPSTPITEKVEDVHYQPQESASYLPPPTSAAHIYTSYSQAMIQNGLYNQNMSPPLTPAVSPPSILLDSLHFKRKFSVDVGPFSFGSISQSINERQDQYRRSSCSAMSVDQCSYDSSYSSSNPNTPANNASNANNNNNPNPSSNDTDPSSNDTTANTTDAQQQQHQQQQHHSSQGPTTQHKHGCSQAYCGWSFKRYEHLKRHMFVHTGERPHMCPYQGCGKSFSRSDNFNAHFRTHTKKNALQKRRSSQGNNNNNNNTTRSKNNSISNGSSDDSGSSTSPLMTVSSQMYDPERAHNGYFTKQNAFDMINYQTMYDHRQAYPEAHAHAHAQTQQTSQQQQQQQNYMRSLTNHYRPGLQTPISPSAAPSLLNHEVGGTPFFGDSGCNNNGGITNGNMTFVASSSGGNSGSIQSPFGYAMSSMSPTSMLSSSSSPMNNTPINNNATSSSSLSLSSAFSTSSSSSATSNSLNIYPPFSHVCPVPQCQRQFKRLEHLKRHMRIHTHERPFACSLCTKAFSRSDNLSQHMKTHQRVEDRRRRQHHHHHTHHHQQQQQQQHQHQQQQQHSNGPFAKLHNTMSAMNWHTHSSNGC